MRGAGKKFTGAKAKQRNNGLGEGLVNAKNHDRHRAPVVQYRHTTDFLSPNGQSVVDEGDLMQIVAEAHLNNQNFEAQREMQIVDPSADTTTL